MSKRGIRGPLLCIGDLLNDIGEEEEKGRGHSLLREASPSPSSSLLNNLTKLFQEHYDHLNSTLSGTDHSWTSLTLKVMLCVPISYHKPNPILLNDAIYHCCCCCCCCCITLRILQCEPIRNYGSHAVIVIENSVCIEM
ncbi:hypothetical protein JHK87_035569 [Glycine soja]|nr:hypothetical protein JHK87_035569 [Glycine soja]